MIGYVLRRTGVSVVMLVFATFVIFTLTSIVTNPLADLQGTDNPNAAGLIRARTELLGLDQPAPVRWVNWLMGAAGCLVPAVGSCQLGTTIAGAPVTSLMPQALGATLQLVSGATVLAIVLGIAAGVALALRINSALDNSASGLTFLLISTPSFLIAVLLKAFLGLSFNDYLARPEITVPALATIAGLCAASAVLIARGSPLRRAIVAGVTVTVVLGAVALMVTTGWLFRPGIGPVAIALGAGLVGYGALRLFSEPDRPRAWWSLGLALLLVALTGIGFGRLIDAGGPVLVVLAAGLGLCAAAAGFAVGGIERAAAIKIAVPTALAGFGFLVLDRYLAAWPEYLALTNGRPIATVGSATPGLDGDFWLTGLDSFTHYLLPTVGLTVFGMVGYLRYTRATLSEAIGLDFVRAARAKGLPEHTVIVRHALRNTMIPISTIIAFDFAGVLGGAVITETIFGIPGMGTLLVSSLGRGDIFPLMASLTLLAALAIIMNFVADLLYAFLDPRVRVR